MSHRNHHHEHQHSNTQAIPHSEQTPQTNLRDEGSIIDRIRIRAFEISKARNGGPGDERTDWFQAERELRAPSKQEA